MTTDSASLKDLISSYGILPTLASWMSTIDLYNLALTNRAHFSHILASPIFRVLRSQSLCDGHGLIKRQEFRPPYFSDPLAGLSHEHPDMAGDEEIEVFLYNVKCDEAGSLPCIKCGINVCEECRYYPRAAPPNWFPNRRPHLRTNCRVDNIMCLCPPCDAAVETEVAGKFLSQLCDCDLYKRWICAKCAEEELQFSTGYLNNHTKQEWEWDATQYEVEQGYTPSKIIRDQAFDRAFWCVCGAQPDASVRPRCTWCKRRHLPEEEWLEEFEHVGSKLPFFDNNLDYPRWISDANGSYPVPYPRLGPDSERIA
ncbi:hypothetical protein AK830_g7001 [Neonectria ditissima]|uniref:Uncharacterized protein n=1 Tax=Neonectria ditissima TaxID=78410 RepID=A0A0P7BH51_9HYPO|nr:hypothetical protein AK830_g7001 [Neonectria ditissima]